MSPTETRDSHRGDVTSFNGRSYSTKPFNDYRRNSFPNSIAGSNVGQMSRNDGPQVEAAPISVTANVKIDIPQKNPYLSRSPSPLPSSPLPPTVQSLQMPGIALVPATPMPVTPELYLQQGMNDIGPVPNGRYKWIFFLFFFWNILSSFEFFCKRNLTEALYLANFSFYIIHCVKNVCIRSYSGPYFPAFGLNT